MGSRNRHFSDSSVGPRKPKNAIRDREYVFEPCNLNPVLLGTDNASFPDGLDTTFVRAHLPTHGILGINIGINTTFGPIYSNGNNGLSVLPTQTDDIGFGWVFATGFNADSPGNYTIGTSPAFFWRMQFTISSVAGTDECVFGLRKSESFQADYEAYDEMAAFNIDAGNVFVETIINGVGPTKVDSGINWLDTETHEVMMVVGNPGTALGAVEFFYDGDSIGVNPFTFDDGEVVVPFFQAIQDIGLTNVYWNQYEYGDLRTVERGV